MYELLGLIIGVIGTSIAIYQAAIINASKKRKNELQYLFAGINAAALQKQKAWQNQISLLPKPSNPTEWAVAQAHIRARDDMAELANLTSALEGTIDPDESAIVAMMDKYKAIVDKNSRLQTSADFKTTAKKSTTESASNVSAD